MATTPDARQSTLSSGLPGLQALGMPRRATGIYQTALTHRSFAFENRGDADDPAVHNERLEILGDAVIEALVTDLIFTSYPDLSEGRISQLRASVVNTHALAELAHEAGIGDALRLGKGEEASGGRLKPSLLAGAFEAVAGAVYIKRGWGFFRRHFDPIFRERITAALSEGERYDSKNALQEAVVRETSELPTYRVAASGPDHDRRYTADVYVDSELYGSGVGRSKKEAEQNAARAALTRFTAEDPGARAS